MCCIISDKKEDATDFKHIPINKMYRGATILAAPFAYTRFQLRSRISFDSIQSLAESST